MKGSSTQRKGKMMNEPVPWIPIVLFALSGGIIITSIVTSLNKKRSRAGMSGWAIFLLIFLGTWAVLAWITPVGPLYWGVPWFPGMFTLVVLALLLLTFAEGDSFRGQHPVESGINPREAHRNSLRAADDLSAGVGLFFWMLISVLIFLVLFSLIA